MLLFSIATLCSDNPSPLDAIAPVLERLLTQIREDITSAEATTYAEATATLTLGNKVTPIISSPQDLAPNGRKVVVSPIADGSVTGTGTATHWALVDTVNSRLLATKTLDAPVGVTSGNVFTLDAIDIGIPDAV